MEHRVVAAEDRLDLARLRLHGSIVVVDVIDGRFFDVWEQVVEKRRTGFGWTVVPLCRLGVWALATDWEPL